MSAGASRTAGVRCCCGYENRLRAMRMKTFVDLELRTLLRDELRALHLYIQIFGEMAKDEKNELCEWMAQGNSVNSNPFSIYGENGCLMDFINARQFVEEMAGNCGIYLRDDGHELDAEPAQDQDLPF